MDIIKTIHGSKFVLQVIICLLFVQICFGHFSQQQLNVYRQRVEAMFYHAYDSYIHHAYPRDELKPLTCDGMDTWGSFSLTLIDALDTLAVMGNFTEFQRVAQLLVDEMHFDTNINVSVFETNIRVVGGLLSAHLLSHRAGIKLEPEWPCDGPLLRLAETVAQKLLPAFDTPTGMPYGTVNLLYGVPKHETPVTCTAGVTTYIVEFGTLSRLTGNPIYEQVALRSLLAMWEAKSSIGLVGNHIDVITGKWTAVDSGIGAGVDSYYEYLVKGSILLQRPELMSMFQEYRQGIEKYMVQDDWYMWVNMNKGQVTMPLFQSLEAYWPGLLSLVGELEQALKSLFNYHQIWKQYGFTPEFYNIPASEANVNREGYPLRPELIESVMYLYRATQDPTIMHMGVDILESIQYSARTPCGYATIKDVRDHKLEDRMESFFLAETTKYLYLLFDTKNFIHDNGSRGTVVNTANGKCILNTGGYIFNTEAHPIDMSAIYCCSQQKKKDDAILKQYENSVDLLALFDLTGDDPLKRFRRIYKHHLPRTQPTMKRKSTFGNKKKKADIKITPPTKTSEIPDLEKLNEKLKYSQELRTLTKSPEIKFCKQVTFIDFIKSLRRRKFRKPMDLNYFPNKVKKTDDLLKLLQLAKDVLRKSETKHEIKDNAHIHRETILNSHYIKVCSSSRLVQFKNLLESFSNKLLTDDVKTHKLVSSMDRDDEIMQYVTTVEDMINDVSEKKSPNEDTESVNQNDFHTEASDNNCDIGDNGVKSNVSSGKFVLANNYETDLKFKHAHLIDYSAMKCSAQSFLQKLSMMGEMFGGD